MKMSQYTIAKVFPQRTGPQRTGVTPDPIYAQSYLPYDIEYFCKTNTIFET